MERDVAASTQNQALCALLFLYREVLRIDLPRIEEAVRARRSRRVPTVLTRDEVRAVMTHLDGVHAVVPASSTAAEAGIVKPAGCHTLRHSFATHLLEDGLRHPHRPGTARPR